MLSDCMLATWKRCDDEQTRWVVITGHAPEATEARGEAFAGRPPQAIRNGHLRENGGGRRRDGSNRRDGDTRRRGAGGGKHLLRRGRRGARAHHLLLRSGEDGGRARRRRRAGRARARPLPRAADGARPAARGDGGAAARGRAHGCAGRRVARAAPAHLPRHVHALQGAHISDKALALPEPQP
eukprot:scaffold79778_cov48-Phaeocystis_antarctica.AAC.1